MRLSPSKLTLYGICGEAFRRIVIEGEQEPANPSQIRGKGTHRSAEMNYRHKLEKQENLRLSEVQDIARDYVHQLFEEQEVVDPDRPYASKKELADESSDASVRLASIYHNDIGMSTNPKRVEEKIELEIAPHLTLVQILDVQDMDGVISDIKTSAHRKQQLEADTSPQLTLQWMATRALDGEEAPYVRLDVLLDKRKPEIQSLVSTRSMKDAQVLLNLSNAVMHGVASGVFIPAALTNHWKCNPKFCGFYRDCKYVNAR